MGAIQVTRRIAAPVEQVFQTFSQIDTAAERIGDITQIEMLTPGSVGVGTRFRETRKMFGKEASEEMEFTTFEPNDRYVLEAQSHGAHYTTTFLFSPAETSTDVTVSFFARPVSLGARLFAPLSILFRGMLKKCLQRDLDDLQRHLEQGDSPQVVAT